MRHRTVDLDGPVHFLDYDGPSDGPTFVLVHGLGGSHTNWLGVGELLARRGRVLVPDLIGFGKTPLAGRSTSMHANRDLLGRFIREVAEEPAVVIGNSMGGLIVSLLAIDDPELVSGLVLVDPALPRTAGQSVDTTTAGFFAASVIPRFAASFINRHIGIFSAERMVEEMFRLCMADPSRVDPELVDAQVEMARERITQPWATHAFLEASRSLVRLLARRKRFLQRLCDISAPTLLLMGAQDRLVPIAVAKAAARMCPHWDVIVFDDLGHAPQMEDPRSFFVAVDAWMHGPASWLLTGRRSLAGEARAPAEESAWPTGA
jgi:pimeloyl-ACP methyl ester carboxylesterase